MQNMETLDFQLSHYPNLEQFLNLLTVDDQYIGHLIGRVCRRDSASTGEIMKKALKILERG